MPLEEYTRLTVEGLVSGKPEIPLGFAIGAFAKYEAGKREALEGGWKSPGN